jgi:ABC-2 type transport system ATP-binding protein
MLELIQRIGTEFGISIMLSSHLLSEIERVCQHLVEIEGGRLVRSTPMAELTALTQILAVEVEGETAGLAEYLRKRGVTVDINGRFLLVQRESDEVYDLIRDGVVELGLGLVRLEQSRRRLEELFEAGALESTVEAAGG